MLSLTMNEKWFQWSCGIINVCVVWRVLFPLSSLSSSTLFFECFVDTSCFIALSPGIENLFEYLNFDFSLVIAALTFFELFLLLTKKVLWYHPCTRQCICLRIMSYNFVALPSTLWFICQIEICCMFIKSTILFFLLYNLTLINDFMRTPHYNA